MATDARDLALGVAAVGMRGARDAGRVVLLPVRIVAHVPLAGPPLRRAADDLEADGRALRLWLRERVELLAGEIVAAPEVERAIDSALAGPLIDTLARSLAEHRVVDRVAAQVAATVDLEQLALQVARTVDLERLAAQLAATVDLERLLVRALESPLMAALTERIVNSPEMQRVVEHIAGSPEVRRALTQQGTSLAEEMVAGVRRRSETLDETAERAVRGWLRRPRPKPA
jgi:hypothetical protein